MTAKDVAKRDGAGALALPTDGELGVSGEASQEDVVTPICSVVQPSSGSERGEQGRYWFPDGTSVERLEGVVVLEVAFTRTLWAPKSAGDGTPVCRSPNRKEGMTTKPSDVLGVDVAGKQNMTDGQMVYIPCEVCPHHKDDQFSSADWLCKRGFTLLLHQEERGPFLFFVKGMASDPVKRTIVSPAIRRIQQGQPAAPWSVSYNFGLRLTENDKGKFYVPEILAGGATSDPDSYRAMAQEFRGHVGEQMAKAAEEEGQQEMMPDEAEA